MANPERVKDLRKIIDEILNDYKPKIYSKQSFQQNMKKDNESLLDEAFTLIKKIEGSDLTAIPDGYVEQLFEKIKDFKEIFKQAMEVGNGQEGNGDIIRYRDLIIKRIKTQYDNLYGTLQHITLFPSYDSVDVVKKIDEIDDKGSKVVEDIKQAFTEEGISPLVHHYKDTAERHSASAVKWLFGVGCSLIGLFAILLFFDYDCKEESLLILVCTGISRILVIGAGVYALNFCSKNFSNEKHNEVVNYHRYNSLRTLLALLKTETKDDVKDQVLQHACATIFGSSATGFSKNRDVPLHPILEIIKQIRDILKNGK